MSGVYWGIVAGLFAMVATLFVCIDIAYSKPKGSAQAQGGGIDESSGGVGSASTGSRQAA